VAAVGWPAVAQGGSAEPGGWPPGVAGPCGGRPRGADCGRRRQPRAAAAGPRVSDDPVGSSRRPRGGTGSAIGLGYGGSARLVLRGGRDRRVGAVGSRSAVAALGRAGMVPGSQAQGRRDRFRPGSRAAAGRYGGPWRRGERRVRAGFPTRVTGLPGSRANSSRNGRGERAGGYLTRLPGTGRPACYDEATALRGPAPNTWSPSRSPADAPLCRAYTGRLAVVLHAASDVRSRPGQARPRRLYPR
jgi:hypothetical protein